MKITDGLKFFALKCCLFAISIFGLVVVKNFAHPGLYKNPAQAQAAFTNASGQLLVPMVGHSYTLGYLFDLINTNNPAQTSNFIVPATGTGAANAQPITHPQCWPSSGAHLTMGIPADNIGLTIGQLNKNTGSAAIRNTTVTLQEDPVLIQALSQPYNPSNPISATLTTQSFAGIPATAPSYQKILLYFLYTSPKNRQTYRCYLNDVLPPRAVNYEGLNPATGRAQIISRNPAQNIIVKWAVPAN